MLTSLNQFLFNIPKIENPKIRIIMITPRSLVSSRKNLEYANQLHSFEIVKENEGKVPVMGASFYNSYNVRFIKPMERSEYDKIEEP